jgi:predicted transposase YbfD/YdcC
MDKALNLEAGFSGGLAGLVFNPEEVKIEGDAAITETRNKLNELRSKLDGYRLQEKNAQEQGNKSTTDNQGQLNDELEKLRAENLADAEAKALELLRIEYEKHRQELIDKKASQELLLELDKNYGINQQQIRDDFAEQRKAKEEEDAKALEELRQKNADEQLAREEKEYSDSLANVENYYKQKQLLLNQSLINGEITQEQYDQRATSLETDLLEAKLQVQRDYGDNSIDTELAISQQQIDINAQRNEAIKAQDEALKEAKETLYNSTVALGDALISLIGDQTKVGKGLALAQIAADTARALSGALANANSPTPDNIATGGLAGIAKYITLATQILGNAKRAKDVLKGGGSVSIPTGGGSTSVPEINTRQFQTSSLGQDFTGQSRVYVTEGDITRTQKRVQTNQRVSVIGG